MTPANRFILKCLQDIFSRCRIPALIALLLLVTTMSSCAPVGPNYTPPAQQDIPLTWTQPEDIKRSAAVNDLSRWWTICNDPALSSLIDRAKANNPGLAIANIRIRQARSEYRLVTSRKAPEIGSEGSYAASRRSENITGSTRGTTQDLFELNLGVSWELDLFGGTRRAIEQADAELDAIREDLNAVQIALLADVAFNYFELRGQQQLLQTSLENIRVQEQTFALAKGLYDSGLGNRLDVAQAQTQLELSRSRLPGLKNNIDQAVQRLALLIGEPSSLLMKGLREILPLPILPPLIPDILPTELLRRRPDIRRAERNLAAANAAIGVAMADLYPKLDLAAAVGLQSIHLTDLLQYGSRYWSAGPTINWALFYGGRVRANIEVQEAQFDIARESYRQVVLNALNEVESALFELSHEQQTYQALSAAVATARHAVELATGRYRSGLTDLSEVLLSERTLFQLQEQLINSNKQLAVDMVVLYKAFGGGWTLPPAQQSEAPADLIQPAEDQSS